MGTFIKEQSEGLPVLYKIVSTIHSALDRIKRKILILAPIKKEKI